jgi:succinyl-diaminopimelate desuccinylase
MVHSVTELTQALVRIPSVNPDGEPGTTEVGEKRCAEYVAEFLQHAGATVQLEEILPDRPNVIGRFPSRGAKKPRILFAPHTDTVGVGGMVIEPFSGELRDNKIWGRGSSDTKGPMASMLWALYELRDELADLPVEVHFAGFMSEESSQHGSRHFAQHYPDYDFALIGEPTSLQTVYKHKGCLWADVHTFGHAVHASTPELGVNAITQMAAVIQALDQRLRTLLVERGGTDPVLGQSTLNIAIIHGGTRSNIVPEACSLRVDMRVTPLLAREGGAFALLEQIVHQTQPNAKIELATEAPPLDTSADSPWVKSLVRSGAALTGAPWFCDAAYLAQRGIPSVAIGPGSIAQAHTKDEFISTADLEAGVRFFKQWLRSLVPLLIALFLLPACSKATPPVGDGCVWQVSDADSCIYVAGTIHLLRKEDHPLPAAYEKAYQASQNLVFELPPAPGRGELLAKLFSAKGSLAEGQKLADSLPPQDWQQLQDWCTGVGLSPETFDTMRPWFTALIVTTTEFQRLGAKSEYGVEPFFEKKASEDNKPTSGLETVEQQVDLFAKLSPKQEQDLLRQTMLEVKAVQSHFQSMLKSWRSGDIEALYALLTSESEKYPELIELFLHQRNADWINQLSAMLEKPQTAYVLVGAGHLGGEKGVLAGLRARGFKVERIRESGAEAVNK